jgi:hypothetical protein
MLHLTCLFSCFTFLLIFYCCPFLFVFAIYFYLVIFFRLIILFRPTFLFSVVFCPYPLLCRISLFCGFFILTLIRSLLLPSISLGSPLVFLYFRIYTSKKTNIPLSALTSDGPFSGSTPMEPKPFKLSMTAPTTTDGAPEALTSISQRGSQLSICSWVCRDNVLSNARASGISASVAPRPFSTMQQKTPRCRP